MESMNWLRLGAIAALVLGSIYVLLPTALQDEASQIAAFEEHAGLQEDAGRVPLTVARGDRDAVLDALVERLSVAGVTVDGIEAEGEADIVVRPGETATDAITSLIGPRSQAVLVDLGAFEVEAVDGDALPENVATVLTEAKVSPDAQTELAAVRRAVSLDDAGLAALPTRPVTGLEVETTEEGTTLTAVLGLTDEASTALVRVLLVEGVPVAAVLKDDVTIALDEEARPALAKLVSLEGVVETKRGRASDSEGDELVAAPAESNVPAWLLNILPDTKLNLGLDLQGGIDLTLQVELDTAILNQAKRDTQGLVDRAREDDLTIASVTRQFSEPVLEFVTDEPLGDLTAFVRKQLGIDYQYIESDGNTHRFEMTDERRAEVADQSMSQVLETLRKRIDATGVKEPSIVQKGSGRINVQLPGLEDPRVAIDVIQQAAVLEFHMVDMEFDDSVLEEMVDAAQDELPESQFFDDELLNRWLHDTGRLDPELIVLWSEPGNEEQWSGAVDIWPRKRTTEGTVLEAAPMVLFDRVDLTGNDINNAAVGFDQNNQAGVSIDFKPRGGQVFCDLTKEAVGKRFAIVLDDIIMSAPSIRERICGGSARIDMNASIDPLAESKALALVLRTGALDAPVVVASVNKVGSSLGADAIAQGTEGAVVGALIVLVLMALWYRTSGLIADFALAVNILMVLAGLASFGATLTLPGIAGIALTVGMAVDANIIIYERIREELRLGVQPRKAVDVGFEKAVVAVLDANITTAIAGVVLYSYGTGPIKGFAVTLLIGIGTTLVSALFVTRTIMELVTRSSSARLRI